MIKYKCLTFLFSHARFCLGSVAVFFVAFAIRVNAEVPRDNPVMARYGEETPEWIQTLPWDRVVSVADMAGESDGERYETARREVEAMGGGVVYFPPGVYQFSDSLVMGDGVILRGAAPEEDEDGLVWPTRFSFPRYEPVLEGEGTPVDTAFKHIRLAAPSTDSRLGVAHIAINHGHIHFGHGAEFATGTDRFVFGCELRNTAYIDRGVPDANYDQKPWQRWTQRHRAAIHINAEENLFVAGNRVPESGEANFEMPGYVVHRPLGIHSQAFRLGQHRSEAVELEEIAFDYDNRPGIYANSQPIGPPQSSPEPLGTPESHPHGFRTGMVIRDNYIFATGRTAISFAGDGVLCLDNTIRFAENVYRPTTTGRVTSDGSATNDNRAVRMHGYRWTVQGTDFEVYKNRSFNRGQWINDGEGLMHERHTNSEIRDSRLIDNRGNAYLCMWRVPIRGLEIRGNVMDTDSSIGDIVVLGHHSHGGVTLQGIVIEDNVTRGRGISVTGGEADNDVLIRGNRHEGENGRIRNTAGARLEGNEGYEIVEE